ncbi:MAG: S8 family serine peptidase, partial [Bacteroidota bacterium]
PKMKAYGGNRNLDDQHGTEVWEMVGGYHPGKNIQHGLATEATYYLARTDHGAGEKRLEEEYFIKALEWMIGKGIRLINTSLGYTNGYDNPKENYVPSQMDGTSAIAVACQKAIDQYDVIIVGAAGNEGNLPWKVINTPADARGVIAVGASKVNLLDKMGYSSIGPYFLDYLKPELTCYSSSGTSFAAPVITGLVACMLQSNPELSNDAIRKMLFASCSLYPYGNNYVGYGVPDARKINDLLASKDSVAHGIRKVVISARTGPLKGILPSRKFRFRMKDTSAIIYHKYDQWKVSSKQLLQPHRKKVALNQPENTQQTTVIIGEQVYEVFWQGK